MRDHRHDGRRRRGEADADRASRGGENCGVDADHLALQIEQRPAGITLVDRGVGLKEVVIRPVVDIAIAGGNDAGGHGFAEAERIADRHHAVADAHLVAVAEFDCLERLVALHLQHRHIHLRILADHLGLELAAIGEDDEDVVGVPNHVIVGDDDAARIDHEARTQGLRTAGAGLRVDAVILEEFLEHLVERRALRQIGSGVLVFDGLSGGDIHHRVGDLVDEVGEIGGPPLRRRGGGRRQHQRGAENNRSDSQRTGRFCGAAPRCRNPQPVVQHWVSPQVLRSIRQIPAMKSLISVRLG